MTRESSEKLVFRNRLFAVMVRAVWLEPAHSCPGEGGGGQRRRENNHAVSRGAWIAGRQILEMERAKIENNRGGLAAAAWAPRPGTGSAFGEGEGGWAAVKTKIKDLWKRR